MPEVIVLFEHWGLIDVIVGRNASSVSIFRQLLDIFGIISADIDIEEYDVTVGILFAEDVFQVFFRWHERFRKTWLHVPGVHCEVEGRYARVAQAVRNFRPQQAPVRCNIYPKALLRCVVDHSVHEIRTKRRLSFHQR